VKVEPATFIRGSHRIHLADPKRVAQSEVRHSDWHLGFDSAAGRLESIVDAGQVDGSALMVGLYGSSKVEGHQPHHACSACLVSRHVLAGENDSLLSVT
jgi:hypothetical protein